MVDSPDTKPVKVEIVEGHEGMIVYFDDVRVVGEKPSSGGHPIIYSFLAKRVRKAPDRIEQLEAALKKAADRFDEIGRNEDAVDAYAALEGKR